MRIDVDLTDCADDIQPGTYRVRVTDVKEEVSKVKKTPLVAWTLATVGEDDPKNEGRVLWHRTPAKGPGAVFLKRWYKALTGEALPSEGLETEFVMGRELVVVVDEKLDAEGAPTGGVEVKSYKPAL